MVIDTHCHLDKDDYENLDEIINQTYINISFFVVIYAYTSATIFLDHYEQGVTKQKTYFRKHFSIIQRSIDKHIFKIVKSNLYDLLYKNYIH